MKDQLTKQLLEDEGERLQAYQDHLGYWTIGVGRLIDGRKGGGISKEESRMLLGNDIDKVCSALQEKLHFWDRLNDARKAALCTMAFQMGIEGLLKFKLSLASLANGNYVEASNRMLQSTWAKQTPNRAKKVTEQIKTGEWQ